MAGKPGTSQFTHIDDSRAPIHTTDPEHHESHVYGGDVAPKQELTTTILGPPAFGSPDVRTLGHIMHPETESASAPALDPEFTELQQARGQAGWITEEQLQEKSEDELKAIGNQLGLTFPDGASKQQMIDAIFADEEEEQTEEEKKTENAPTNYEEMSKADLLDLAQSRNLNVDAGTSKDDVITALQEADKSTATT